MKTYWRYLRQLLRHKWFTFLECRELGIPWLGLVHDWTKFLPGEFIPYAQWFYGSKSSLPAWAAGGDFAPGDTIDVWAGANPFQLVVQTVEGDTLWVRSVEDKQDFDLGWNRHQKCNKHHWQYWILIEDDSGIMGRKALPMPDRYRREMLADWRGAGRAYGTPDTRAWYLKSRHRMLLYPGVRSWIECQLEVFGDDRWQGDENG